MIKANVNNGMVEMSMKGTEGRLITESMVLLKACYEALAEHNKDVKAQFLPVLVFTLFSGKLFNEEPDEECLKAFYDMTFSCDADETLRKAFEEASAYGD